MSTDSVSVQAVAPPRPQGRYVPAVLHNDIVYTAGMTPRRDGELVARGVVGATVSPGTARDAARLAAGNALAAARSVLPSPQTSLRCLQMIVYIACTPEFHDLSQVADGASDALAAELGADALPARTAIGVLTLPSAAPVEIALTAAVVRAGGS